MDTPNCYDDLSTQPALPMRGCRTLELYLRGQYAATLIAQTQPELDMMQDELITHLLTPRQDWTYYVSVIGGLNPEAHALAAKFADSQSFTGESRAMVVATTTREGAQTLLAYLEHSRPKRAPSTTIDRSITGTN